MKSYETVFVGKGPPTYSNAEEAWFQYRCKTKETILFVFIPAGNPHYRLERMRSIIDYEKWGEVVWVKSRSNIAYKKNQGWVVSQDKKIKTHKVFCLLG